MKKQEKIVSGDWLGRTLTIKTGKLALQADAAVLVQYGETVVLATAVESKNEREGVDFFPLSVDFEEKLYAAGIIKGSRWIKREGRPTDQAVLTGRMIDRSLRPLFNQSSRKDIQVITTVLSVDGENDHDIVSLIAASAALAISGIEWAGPLGGVRVGLIEDKFVYNPTHEQQEASSLDLIVAGTRDRVIMIEAGAKEVKEEIIAEGILNGLKELQPAINLIEELKSVVDIKEKIEKKKFSTPDELARKEAKEKTLELGRVWLKDNVKNYLFDKIYYTKGERKAAVSAIKSALDEYLFSQNLEKPDRDFVIKKTVEAAIDEEVTRAILEDDHRVDGRAIDEIRGLYSEAGLLPRNHGTGLFSRGETQVMSVVTLGAPGLEQTLEGMNGTSKKSYMHHYNFPPYSVGETSPLRGTGRREIGHGALAEKALMPVLPEKDTFPYAIRVVSETLGSNGSSSMGATCGSTLALMDAGVPIKKHVAGIAMGMSSTKDMGQWKILTDIQDLEDGDGGMDFKITGTDVGLTAIQLDTKSIGIDEAIIRETLTKGRTALNQILEVLKEAIPAPRSELSKYAPRIISIRINSEKIGAVIGSGGKTINKLVEDFEVTIDIEDDGLVMICGIDAAKCLLAAEAVKAIVKEYEAGETVKGEVVRLMDFGAFVELEKSGQDGMIHVSEMAPYRVGKPGDMLAVGDEVMVHIKEIGDGGKISLSMKGLAENEHFWKEEKGKMTGDSFNNSRRPQRSDDRPRNGRPRF